ncbi:MAG: MFS transporter [Tannerellaceae bacterium]|nr:MFS transporter [Tannerellaceae bacterium]
MGFVDVVGIATSYVKQDFGLNDKLANLLPMLVFLWFAICSLPTGILMGKIGRKRTVLLSAGITTLAMLISLFRYSFPAVLTAFALLGIGNTILQVSLNPLLTDIVAEKKVTSMLTLGQFIKAISSFLGPILAGVATGTWGNWRLVFPVYAAATLLSFLWLQFTPVKEVVHDDKQQTGAKIISLLKNKQLLLLFSIIVLIVGFEIGLMTAVPKYLTERYSLPLDKGGFACSLYYAARTLGTFAGSFLLLKLSPRSFFINTLVVAILAFGVLMGTGHVTVWMVALFLVGLTCANVFAIVFGAALRTGPSSTNEISALMIMGVAGGALIPPVMGILADATTQWTSLFILLFTLQYILITAFYVLKK